jgi:Methane oxygenase PmoA
MKDSPTFPRVQAVPGIGRASLRLDGVERAAYEFGEGDTRPYVFPLIGSSGAGLTRMGHPNPIGHEHHKSVWFGHQSVAGINFWEDRPSSDIRIRHRCVRLYHDGYQWGGLVADLDWWAEGRSILHHELVLAIEPTATGGFALDLQSRLESAGGGPVELGKTNFGFLGVRVAKTMSEQFGGGRVLNARGFIGESAVFGEPSAWVDYSGPSASGKVDGVCFMDHPANPGHPVSWHVRADGWMGASFNRESGYGVARDHPLLLRYRLLVHPGQPSHKELAADWEAFAATAPYSIVPPHGGNLAALERSTTSI